MTRTGRKILILITRGDILGGAQSHVLDISRGLIDRGDDVFVAVGSSGLFTQELDKDQINWCRVDHLDRSINPLNELFAVVAFISLLRKIRPELIYAHTAKAGLVGRFAAFLLGLPIVYTVHGWQFAPGISWGQRLIVYFSECILSRIVRKQAVICVSNYDMSLARRSRAVPVQRLHRVWNGRADVRPDRVRNHLLCNHPDMPVRLIMPARFEGQKDHLTLFRALSIIYDQDKEKINWEIVLPGDGNTRSGCQKLVESFGLPSERIQFPGHCHDLDDRLGKSDIFLLISHWEGLPQVIIEGMRAGLPVVASNVGGCSEMVLDGVNGFLIPHRDETMLAEKIQLLICNPRLRAQLGEAGRKRYLEHFQLEVCFARTSMVIDKLFS